MSKTDKQIDELEIRLKHLEKYEESFKREIRSIRTELNSLRRGSRDSSKKKDAFSDSSRPRNNYKKPPRNPPPPQPQEPLDPPLFTVQENRAPLIDKSNIEKFVGTYLISIVGVLVTIIGVGIGAKYAIDNDLVSPLGRIVFGYAVGFGLLGFAVRLKEKYLTFSSVLLSGGMAVMYFVTYFAYDFYSLISQTTAFSLMVIFTIFTVISALIYDRRIIAHIGLVGAYAVPFLLSENSGRADILFGYIAIINVGILIISVFKYWKYLFYSSFILTWLIYAVWYLDRYNPSENFSVGLGFLTVFFAIFYATFLAYKLVHRKPFNIENTALVLQNSCIFFGFGYSILSNSSWSDFLGSFALLNAVIHFGVAAIVSKYWLGDRNALYLIVVLILTFITIAVPIQLDGNWITILWIAEATFLFVIGRTKRIPLFEYSSYALMIIACLSLLKDWWILYEQWITLTPILNWAFVTSISVIAGLAVISFVDRDRRYKTQTEESLSLFLKYAIPCALLIILYNTFRMEIGNYFYLETAGEYQPGKFLHNVLWQINYSAFFLTALSFSNTFYLKKTVFGIANLLLNGLVKAIFLLFGLVVISQLRYQALLPDLLPSEVSSLASHLAIRYISIGFLAALVFASYRYIKEEFLTKAIPSNLLQFVFDIGLSFTGLVLLSSELLSWSEIFGFKETDKLGLSILWGVYAIALIALGIVWRKKHVRIFAIGLFAVTLVKLFFYDIVTLDTISKTIVFVSIGILLLGASFLYNKYTKQIFDE